MLMKHLINEWQDFSLRKDVEKISRELQKENKYEKPLIVEILIVVTTLLLDKLFDLFNQCIEIQKIVVVSLALLSLATLAYILIVFIKDYLYVKCVIKKSKVNIKSYVDSFDNNVCYYALTSCNFYENLLQISSDILAKNAEELKEKRDFFYIETNYYINKCIAELNKMENVIKDVFTDNPEEVICNSKIHISRLKNIIDLLCEIRKNLYLMETTEAFLHTRKISLTYDAVMNNILKRTNELRLFKDKLLWIESQ